MSQTTMHLFRLQQQLSCSTLSRAHYTYNIMMDICTLNTEHNNNRRQNNAVSIESHQIAQKSLSKCIQTCFLPTRYLGPWWHRVSFLQGKTDCSLVKRQNITVFSYSHTSNTNLLRVNSSYISEEHWCCREIGEQGRR